MSDDEVRFGAFRLDLGRRELSRDGTVVQLGSRAIDILCVLAAAKGGVVTKDELMERVWPGLVVAEGNIHVHVSALRKAFDEGKDGLNYLVTVPGRGYRFVGQPFPVPAEGGKTAPQQGLPIPDRPSIAVLPFTNLSGDPEQEYFADGIVEDITTALSRMRWLFVIARNSSFTFKGRAIDVKEIGRELGVRYLLEGSVRKAANRVRITGQLIDAATGGHLWADRFDGPLDDIFELQDQVTARVVGAIAPKLQQAEIERARYKTTESLDAYDYFLRGTASLHRWTRNGNDEALTLLYKATELDPDFATAHGMAAWCHVWRQFNGWITDRQQELAEIMRLVQRVTESGKDDAVALSFGGLALGYGVGDLEGGIALIDRALVLNSNLALAWHASGWIRSYQRDTDVALEHVARAMRLSPLDPLMFSMQLVTGHAHYIVGRYAEAAIWVEKAFREQPDDLRTMRLMAAINARSGRLDEARKWVARGLALDPGMRISNLKDRIGPFHPEDFARYAEALRMAGLPE
jgi:TolB-like protein